MITVHLIEDSALLRKMITEMLHETQDIRVIKASQDPIFAMAHLEKVKPDVIITDIELPRMSGIEFLEKMTDHTPIPTIVFSSQTQAGTPTALRALELGVIDVIAKPSTDVRGAFDLLKQRIRQAARVKLKKRNTSDHQPRTAPAKVPKRATGSRDHAQHRPPKCIVIGASTGGTQALEILLSPLPAEMPPILVVQHMPSQFTSTFAKRLNSVCHLDILEAEDGMPLKAGQVLIAPGGIRHMGISRLGQGLTCALEEGPLVSQHCPSVDVLFKSASQTYARRCIGVLLTGMGQDGARGLRALRETGALTIAQDEHTSVVFGMPGAAVKLNAAVEILPLGQITERLIEVCHHLCDAEKG